MHRVIKSDKIKILTRARYLRKKFASSLPLPIINVSIFLIDDNLTTVKQCATNLTVTNTKLRNYICESHY